MSLRAKVFAAADRLFMRKLDFDLPVAQVRTLAEGRLRTVGEYLQEWKRERRKLAAAMPESIRVTAVELAERIFVCGVIVSARGSATDSEVPAKLQVRTRSKAPSGVLADASGGPVDARHVGDDYYRAMLGPEGDEGPAPSTRAARMSDKVWRFAADPRIAEAAAKILRSAGYPMWAGDINKKLPAKLRIRPPRKPWRDIPAALRGSQLEKVDGRWWFVGEERPERVRAAPKRRRTNLAYARADAEVLLDGVLERLRGSTRPMTVRELLDWMRETFEVPATGKFGVAWLKQSLKRLAMTEARLVRTRDAFRWKVRASSVRRAAVRALAEKPGAKKRKTERRRRKTAKH